MNHLNIYFTIFIYTFAFSLRATKTLVFYSNARNACAVVHANQTAGKLPRRGPLKRGQKQRSNFFANAFTIFPVRRLPYPCDASNFYPFDLTINVFKTDRATCATRALFTSFYHRASTFQNSCNTALTQARNLSIRAGVCALITLEYVILLVFCLLSPNQNKVP